MFSHLGITTTAPILDIKTLSAKISEGNELFVAEDINVNCLPRNIDVLSYLYYLKNESRSRKALKTFYTPVTKKNNFDLEKM